MWAIKKVEGGSVLTWNGKGWGMLPQSHEWVRDYALRLEERYPEGGAWLVAGTVKPRQKGGPWRYTLMDGTSEVIHTDRKADAKRLLQAQMGRKRLPNGILWSLEERSL